MNILWFKKHSATAESYRVPIPIAHLRAYKTASYYVCPRCNTSLDREFMAYCDRCGQCLDWRRHRKAEITQTNYRERCNAELCTK